MSYWFRLYTGILDDPKVQRLPPEIFKGWINILCLAKENDGILPSIEDTAFRLRMTEADATSLIEELVRRGLLDEAPDTHALGPHNWDNRQYKSDVSTERVKRFRNARRNVPETADETPPETETETETEQKPARPAPDAVVPESPEPKPKAATNTSGEPKPKKTTVAAPPPGSITRDECYALFTELRTTVGKYDAPYQRATADFVQLAALYKNCARDNWALSRERFTQAATNYFTTPQSKHTLADLAVRFSDFHKSAFDRFGKPITPDSAQQPPTTTRAAPKEPTAADYALPPAQPLPNKPRTNTANISLARYKPIPRSEKQVDDSIPF